MRRLLLLIAVMVLGTAPAADAHGRRHHHHRRHHVHRMVRHTVPAVASSPATPSMPATPTEADGGVESEEIDPDSPEPGQIVEAGNFAVASTTPAEEARMLAELEAEPEG